ncbi:MAG: hypothetical protein ACLFS3_01790 [Candidatus Aenigmatarchaeota archaeon]
MNNNFVYPGHPKEEEYISEVMNIHFDSENGTPYWLDKKKTYDFDPKEDIKSFASLDKLSEVNQEELIYKRLENFIPKLFSKTDYIVGESSGTTDHKKQIPWHQKTSDKTVDWYKYNLDLHDFPEGENWMSIGPYGLYEEHMKKTANMRDGLFYPVAIETRGIKNMADSAGDFKENPWKLWKLYEALKFKNYIEPTFKTAKEKLETEDIGVVTSAPPFLEILAEEGFTDFEGVLVSGTGFDAEAYESLDNIFPNADVVAMYATSFFGPAFDHPDNDSYVPKYFPYPGRVCLDVVDPETKEPVDYGERGQVKYDIVEPHFLWPNHYERDSAEKVGPKEPFKWCGVKDIQSLS